ncbi:MAG TPA: tetratricopeptide repeat protein [Terriglobia bacterium]|nr:tetratricopeptide repeat protein [Terriglobia bacterium]
MSRVVVAANAESTPSGRDPVAAPAPSGNNKSARPSLRSLASVRLDSTRLLVMTTLVACATLPYLNTLLNGFVYDDHTQVTNNPYLQSFRHLTEIFTTTVWSYVGAQGVTNYYRPMMMLGYLACYRLFGAVAYPFHLVSLLLHVLIVCLLFTITERLTRDRVWALVAALLFALHPIHTESVAWIAAVTDLELTFFYLIAFALFLGLARSGGERSEKKAVLMVAAFALALMSKEQALTLPALAAAYEHFYRKDHRDTLLRQKLARYGPLWLMAAVYMLFRIRFLGALAPVHQMRAVLPRQVLLSAFALLGQYVGKLIWPARLCAFYVFRPSLAFTDLRVLEGLAAVAALAVLFLLLWRSRDPAVRFASFGILWFLATLAPVLNAHWMAANVFAERYLYLPSVGICWLAGLAGTALWRRTRPLPTVRLALVSAALVIAALMTARIFTRDRDWNNDVTLYRRTLELSPDAGPILNNLGTVYWQDGEVGEAETVWTRAFRLTPENAILLNNLGLVASQRKQYGKAVDLFQQAIKLKPNYTDPYLNLGLAYRNMLLDQPAEAQLRIAIALSPLNGRAHDELGELYLGEGRLAQGEDQFRASVRAQPNALGFDALGDLALGRGDASAAASDFRAALGLDQFDSKAHFGLGHIDAEARRTADALREYEAGLLSDPTNATAQSELHKLRQEARAPQSTADPRR